MVLDRSSTDLIQPRAEELHAVPEEITTLVRNLIERRAQSDSWLKINELDRLLAEYPQPEMPLHHLFTKVSGYPELNHYTRSIYLAAGILVTTRIHLYDAPFILSCGIVAVWSDEANGWEILHASHIGETKAGTRRIIYVISPTVWSTCHVTKASTPDEAVDALTMDPAVFGHLDDLSPEKLAAVRANCREEKPAIQ